MSDLIEKARYRANGLLARASLTTGLSLNKPTYICAKMTMRCNSRCVHCNIWKTDFPQPELSTGDWLRILRELRIWLGRFRMVFTGGEALLRKDMCEILTHAVGLGIRVELLSNGIMIDKQLASRVVATGIDQVTLSYDGITPGVHDRFRGMAGFHAATAAAILSLVEERRKQGRPFRILLKTVISANNLPELTAIALWAGEHGLEVLYQPIEQNYGEDDDPSWYRQSSLWISDIASLRKEIGVLRNMKGQGSRVIANSAADFDMFADYFEHPDALMKTIQSHDDKIRRRYCPDAVRGFVIESNGDVRMCFRMEPIGNVGHTSPSTIWRKRERCWTSRCRFRSS